VDSGGIAEDLRGVEDPVADELGAAQWLALPDRNAAERQIARHEEGASLEEIFVEQIQAGERVRG